MLTIGFLSIDHIETNEVDPKLMCDDKNQKFKDLSVLKVIAHKLVFKEKHDKNILDYANVDVLIFNAGPMETQVD